MTNVAISVFGLLLVGTVYRLATLKDWTSDLARKRLGSLLSWWIVSTWVLLCAVGGTIIASLLFATVSTLAFREYARLAFHHDNESSQPNIQRHSENKTNALPAMPIMAVGYVCIASLYAGLAAGADHTLILCLPLACVIIAGSVLMMTTSTKRFTSDVGGLVYGVTLTGCLPAASILLLPSDATPSLAIPSWFLLLICLTEVNDITAAWFGRALGRHKLAPTLSPNKTMEGFIGGTLTTITLAILIGPHLTAMSHATSGILGLAIAIAGTLGDLNMSAIKRSAGVKDSGDVLPGQGGILDRIDSLTFTAPVALLLMKVLS
ncbi:phosphatidate cytidylyltransferase [Rhodopirellula europaea]|uniref:phosphatidate cytidylyltransferase n=1 Tax=Rhodopirellula europaea TaxID=1263866 RepID=UPI003D2A1EA5|tara:strand:+ start:19702 stop:20664 length:963 start_codon:yes stop_codon:yes gene_type:complete